MRLFKSRVSAAWKILLTILVLTILGLLLVFPQRSRRVSERQGVIKTGADLQKAIDAAKFGDTILLEPGITYVGPIVLPNKGAGTGSDTDYITIRTAKLEGIAKEGDRIQPAQHMASMPKIVAKPQQAALSTASKAHHYRFIGIEFSPSENGYSYNLINLGESDYKSIEEFPHHLVFDRCYVHSRGLNTARRGFALNSAETSVINSHVSGFAGAGDETQAIAGWNGPGPFRIVNNFLEGGSEILIFGGTDPSVPNLVPSDIEIRRNRFYRPKEWAQSALIKGTLELKNARRVVIDGNLIDSEIRTTALVITTRNQNGKAPWSIIEDVEVTNNIVRHAASGINFLASDNERASQEARRIRIANNLFFDIVTERAGDNAYFLQLNGGESVTVEHNTVQHEGNTISTYNNPTKGFVFRDNIVQYNSYGIICFTPGPNCPQGDLFCHCLPKALIRGNVLIDNLGAAHNDAMETKYPRGNMFAISFDKVGISAYRQDNWRLGPTSPYRGRASDGKDPGVDFDALTASGVYSAEQGIGFAPAK